MKPQKKDFFLSLLYSISLFLFCFPACRQSVDMAELVRKDRARGIVLPKTDHHYKKVHQYIEEEPDLDYLHASVAAHEAFNDIKFSVRIHWGIYSIWEMNGESWGFLRLSNEKRQEYNNLYKSFNPTPDFE